MLAGIEGAQPQSQTNASFAINTARGGNTARVIVVPKKGAFDEDTAALRPVLERLAQDAAKDMGASEVVGGPAVLLDDFDQATSARFPLARDRARDRDVPGAAAALPRAGARARARCC